MMKLNIRDLRQLYRMNHMVRYNPWQKVNTETVAAHSFYTTLFTAMICDEMKVDPFVKLEAITMALVHDTSEVVTNDITYDAKRVMPGINDLLLTYEKKFIKENFPTVYNTMFEVESLHHAYHVVPLIVKMADVLSVIQYCDNEVELGNRRFIQLLGEAKIRLDQIKYKIEGMGYECPEMSL